MSSTKAELIQRYVAIQDAAVYLGVSPQTIRRRIADTSLPAYKVAGDVIRIRVSDLESLATPLVRSDD